MTVLPPPPPFGTGVGRRGRALRALVAVVLTAALAGCTAPLEPVPADAWILTPLRYDNAPTEEGEPGPAQPTDVTYPMQLIDDTAGGVWGYSAGSWLHLDAEGRTLARYNDRGSSVIEGLAAVTPTLLVASGISADPDAAYGLHLVDTELQSWTLLRAEAGRVGAVAVTGGEVYAVVYSITEPTYTVQRVDILDRAVSTAVTPALEGTVDVAIDVDLVGTVHLATPTERIVVDAEGAVVSREPAASTRPHVAVDDLGQVLWSTARDERAAEPVVIDGGSEDARAILEGRLACGAEGSALTLDARSGDASPATGRPERSIVPLPCLPAGAAWLDDGAAIASVGTEGGAVLVRIERPGSR